MTTLVELLKYHDAPSGEVDRVIMNSDEVVALLKNSPLPSEEKYRNVLLQLARFVEQFRDAMLENPAFSDLYDTLKNPEQLALAKPDFPHFTPMIKYMSPEDKEKNLDNTELLDLIKIDRNDVDNLPRLLNYYHNYHDKTFEKFCNRWFDYTRNEILSIQQFINLEEQNALRQSWLMKPFNPLPDVTVEDEEVAKENQQEVIKRLDLENLGDFQQYYDAIVAKREKSTDSKTQKTCDWFLRYFEAEKTNIQALKNTTHSEKESAIKEDTDVEKGRFTAERKNLENNTESSMPTESSHSAHSQQLDEVVPEEANTVPNKSFEIDTTSSEPGRGQDIEPSVPTESSHSAHSQQLDEVVPEEANTVPNKSFEIDTTPSALGSGQDIEPRATVTTTSHLLDNSNSSIATKTSSVEKDLPPGVEQIAFTLKELNSIKTALTKSVNSVSFRGGFTNSKAKSLELKEMKNNILVALTTGQYNRQGIIKDLEAFAKKANEYRRTKKTTTSFGIFKANIGEIIEEGKMKALENPQERTVYKPKT